MQVATPRRARAISEPMAKAVSRPLNHFTIPRLTVMPAISQPLPKIIKPMAANLAEPGMPSAKGRMSPMNGMLTFQLRCVLNHASMLVPIKLSLQA